MRLEGVAPFGPPAFILAARGAMAVLLLPREDRNVPTICDRWGSPFKTTMRRKTTLPLDG